MGREAYRSLYGDLTKLKDGNALKDPAAGSGSYFSCSSRYPTG